MLKLIGYIVALCAAFSGMYYLYADTGDSTFTLQSSGFRNQSFIPITYTCGGENVSPPLSWSGAPAGTVSYAIACVDPDAPGGNFVHWLVYNIPKGVSSINQNAGQGEGRIPGSTLGRNSFQRNGYDGPCPPPGKPHHYIFTLYALDAVLELAPGQTYSGFLREADSHILGKTILVGLFQRNGK